MQTRKKILIGIVIFLLVYTVTGFYILPAVLRPTLEKKLGQALNRTVTIEDVDINPYTLSARIKWLRINDLENKEIFSSFDKLFINLQASSVIKRALILKEISLERPYVKIIHEGRQQYNFSDLMQTSTPPDNTDKEPVQFFLGNIQVKEGRIDIADSPRNTNHQVSGIQVRLPFLSNIGKDAEVFIQPHLEAVVNGTRIVFEGQTKPFHDSLETILQVNLTGIDIPYYMAYMPEELQIKIPSGSIDMAAEISYTQSRDKTPSLKGSGSLRLSGIKITDTSDLSLLDISQAGINIAPSRFLEKEVHISDISITSPEVTIRRDKEGDINITSLIKSDTQEQEVPEQDADKTPFSLTVDQAGLEDGIFTFSDDSAAGPVSLTADHIRFSLKDFSTAGGKTGTAETSMRINRKGSVSASTTFGMSPVSCEALIRLDGVEPAWVEPYFSDLIRIMITKGSASADGTFTLESGPENQLRAAFKGNSSLKDFASLDKENSDDFVSWKALSFTGMDIGLSPMSISIEEIALEDLSARIIVDPEGKLNLNTVIRKSSEKEAEEEKVGDGAENIHIGKVSLKNGTVSFTDRHIDPYFSTELADINGSVTGLTSMGKESAAVELSGTLDKAAPLEITGTVDPLAEDLFADLHTSFKDIDLTTASPYAGRYIGSTIQKGKLSLDLTYFIKNKELDSKNEVFIDQLTFGEGVESPDALDLPVEFAVSLLKDPEGKISLDLPVTGRTDDPEFSIGKVILQILVNIVKKAASSPFSLLSSMYPGAEELSYVEFEYGRATITANDQEKFDLLLQILRDKPSITLEITGYADPENDLAGLNQYLFEKKLKSRKLMEMIRKGRGAVSVDEVTIAPDEYEGYLSQAYKAETFEKPKNTLGLDASIPVPEMEKLMKDNIRVTENDLRLLASQRAQQVKNYLIQSQQINPDRIFLVEAASPLTPESIEGIGGCRAELNLE